MAKVQHCTKWSQMVPNGRKLSNYPQLSSIVQNGPIWSQNVLNGPKGKKNGPKIFNLVLNSLQCSQMVLNGL